jgi:hypothetical protein
MVGALLAPGKRTVTAALQVMGLGQDEQFAKYHHVLNRASWSACRASQLLLGLLLSTFGPVTAPLVFGIDETIERRWGSHIRARGIYRDPVRSSQRHLVKASGLRWLSLMWLTPIPWAQRIWALPVLSVLAPSERYYAQSVRRHKKLTDWARQMIYQLRRWLPQQALVVVGDSSYAVLALLHACQCLAQPVTFITRLRLDAALYEPVPPYRGCGRPRKKGARLPTLQTLLKAKQTVWQTVTLGWYNGQVRTMELTSQTAVWYHVGKPPVPIRWVLVRDPQGIYEPIALLATDPSHSPLLIVEWFIRRWRMEVTFAEVRAHLGVETQRQWSDRAIARTTPLLFGLFSWTAMAAHLGWSQTPLAVRTTAWYAKPHPTFSDAIAWLRYQCWMASATFQTSSADQDMIKIPRRLFDTLLDTVCYVT